MTKPETMMNDESKTNGQMSNDETKSLRIDVNPRTNAFVSSFGFRHSDVFRISGFVIRISL
jgi:hypothetical protein